ncbi:diguanylate cyclase [Castellaniella sp.]|uniref:GGDEF domain-containing protein n=1 Tax=Castellaniella sp. TaxID=1955812 RepID=UPI00355E4CE5
MTRAPRPLRIRLSHALMLLVMLAIILTQLVGLLGTRNAQRDLLIEASLDTNESFALKIAQSASELLQRAQGDLADVGELMTGSQMNHFVLESEVARLLKLRLGFSIVAVHDVQDHLLAIALKDPAQRPYHHLQSPDMRRLHELREAGVSPAFTTPDGRLAIMLVQPLMDRTDQYVGYLAAAVYLDDDGGLQRLVGSTAFRDDTQLLVIGRAGRLLYDSHPGHVGEGGLDDPAIAQVYQTRQSGRLIHVDHDGVERVAGYAYVPEAQWLVLVQRPLRSVLQGLNDRILGVLLDLLLPTALLVLLAWWSARWIVRPIGHLALLVEGGMSGDLSQSIGRVRCWYTEAQSLQRALLAGIGRARRTIRQLREAAQVDPMTGLGNRRGLEQMLAALVAQQQAFALVALDIDHFKVVNDTYGHAVGDQVLIAFARLVIEVVRADDTTFRVGGEEFLVLMPDADMQDAVQLAERLKSRLAAQPLLPDGKVLTVSAGVADWRLGLSVLAALESADQALYRAKRAGRNRVEAAGSSGKSGKPEI